MDQVKSFKSQASDLTGRSSLTPEKNQTKPSTSASCKPYEKDTWSGSKQVVNISTANTAGADGSNLSIKVPGKAEYEVVEGKGKFVDVQMTANSSSVSQHQDHDEDEWDGDEMDAWFRSSLYLYWKIMYILIILILANINIIII